MSYETKLDSLAIWNVVQATVQSAGWNLEVRVCRFGAASVQMYQEDPIYNQG